MCHKHELAPIRANLLNNFWRIIDKEPIETISFTDFLIDILVKRYECIRKTDVWLLYKFSRKLNKEYADLLDYIDSQAKEGEIIKLEKYVKKKVNGSFSNIIDKFVNAYKDTQEN